MIENILLLLTLALPLMASPGPATLSCAAAGSTYGLRGGAPHLFGILAGNATVILMLATGVTGLIWAVPGAVPVLTALGLGYILYLAWKIANAPVGGAAAEAKRPSAAGAYLMAIANPKAYAAIGAVYASSTLIPGAPTEDAIAKVIVLNLTQFTINSSWLAFGSLFAAILKNPRTGRAINIGFAVLLVASVAMAALV